MRLTGYIARLRRFRNDSQGVVTVEFALITVSALVFLPLIWDLASVISSSMSLSGSMRAGMQYAMSLPSDSTGIANVIQTASGFPSNSVTVTVSQSCECSGSVVTCGGTCSGGGQQAKYETITAQYSVPTMLPYTNYPSSAFPISRTVSVRIQ